MANLNELKKYLYYDFSSGPYTGQDYLTFQTKYINYLRSLCKTNGWELVNVGRGHYFFPLSSKTPMANTCISPLTTCAAVITIGTTASSSVQRLMPRTTGAVTTSTPL